jgi:hypothetical protein
MSDPIDPAMRTIGDDEEDWRDEEETLEDEDEEEEEEEDEEDEKTDSEDDEYDGDNDIVKEVKANFFDPTRKPKELKCPFSDPSRPNPCESHSEPKSRKDVIARHLTKIKTNGGDEQHPLDDDLWLSFEVVWFQTPRPPKFTPKKRKLAKGSAQSRYYKKRKDKQENEESEAKMRLEQGLIGEEEYKKVLIGDKRRKFIAERDTERRVRAEMQTEMDAVTLDMEARLQNERKLRDDIEAKLRELRTRATPSTNPANVADSTAAASAAIADLESARKELEDSYVSLESYKEMLTTLAANVVNFWADERFLAATGMTYMQYYGFEWPTEVSEASFYTFVTLLRAKADWAGEIRSNSSLRHMQRELREWVALETQNVEGSPEDIAALKDIVQTFSSCCDLIRKGEEQASMASKAEAQKRLEEHEELWDAAKAAYRSRFKLDSQPPLQHMLLLNDFADTWRAQKAASERNERAIAQANGLV